MTDAERLQRRLERERAARREAERIAEDSTRVLYDKQRELLLLSTVATACNRAQSADEAIRVALRAVCEHTGWCLGHAFTVREGSDVLDPVPAWFLTDLERFTEFREVTERRTFARGEGLPGRVLARAEAVWIPDVVLDEDFPRANEAQRSGLHGAFALPVRVGPEVVAVLEFYTDQPAEPAPELLTAMSQVADHVARVFERERAQERLEALNNELARSNRDLEQFAYIASHDLSEPLRTISGFVTLLRRRHLVQLDDQGQEFVAYIADGADRMQALIGALLEFSRVGRPDSPTELVDLDEVVAEVADDLGARFQETGGRLEISGPLPEIHGVRGDLSRVFQNLIGNALKFRRPEQPPVVEVRSKRGSGWWTITVADNGIGIPTEHRERIFHVFERLHPRGDYGGTGIGLAVVQRVIETHGGRVWVEDADGGGSAFHFTVPV